MAKRWFLCSALISIIMKNLSTKWSKLQ